jgi:Transposase, Mutator family
MRLAEGHVMQDTSTVPRNPDADRPVRRPLVDDELADELLGKAQAEGVELLGPDGLLSQVTKAVLERALAEEMTGHLGYEKHDPAGRGSGNNRNGTTPKTVLTDVGAVDLAVPRDRAGSFEPQIVRKGQTRLKGFNERIIALYARGMTTRDIRAHLREMYDVEVSPDLISRVTDAVAEELAEWQARPLDHVYPVVFIDALMVKIRVLSLIVWAWLFDLVRLNCDHAPGVLSLRSCCRICRLCVSSGCAGIRAGWCWRPGSAGRRRRAAGAGRCPSRSMAAMCASCGTPRSAACRW